MENKHIGGSLEDFLEEEGILEEVKKVVAERILETDMSEQCECPTCSGTGRQTSIPLDGKDVSEVLAKDMDDLLAIMQFEDCDDCNATGQVNADEVVTLEFEGESITVMKKVADQFRFADISVDKETGEATIVNSGRVIDEAADKNEDREERSGA